MRPGATQAAGFLSLSRQTGGKRLQTIARIKDIAPCAPHSFRPPPAGALVLTGALAVAAPSGLAQPFAVLRPNPVLTPGARRPISAATVCRPGYARRARRVGWATKRAIYREYGIRRHRPYAFEIDHLIALELGGSNRRRNLWPESTRPYNARVKDRLENRLHRLVYGNRLTLGQAQRAIAGNWIAACWKYLGRSCLRPQRASPGSR